MRPMKDLRHYFTHFKSLGGVQSILRSHLSEEHIHDIPASLAVFFDDPDASCPEDGFGWIHWGGRVGQASHRQDAPFFVRKVRAHHTR